MYSIEFDAIIDNGSIQIPLQYRGAFDADVKVILIKSEDPTQLHKTNREAVAFGRLAHRANPALWEQEEKAWERAVIERYGSR